ncbi:hypothetical protein [Nannocystis pusilla]|uniref:hypothetical protein n=1 Tax=Nannocystis pusilla TaxID=889268 RepID=UPI003B7ED7F5
MKEQLAALQREVDFLGAEVTRLRAAAESSSTAYFKACLAEFERRLAGSFLSPKVQIHGRSGSPRIPGSSA